MRRKLITIVGGGVSGMTAALILAKFGHEITLVERSPKLGLTVRGFSREGVYFDTGLHYLGGLGEDGPLTRYCRFLGLGDLETAAFNPDGFDVIRFLAEGREVRLCSGYDALKARLHSAFPGEEEAVDAYLGEARAVFEASPFLNMAGDIQELIAAEAAYDSLSAFLAEKTDDPVLRATLAIHTLLHGTPPKEVSFLHHARVASSYFESAHTFVGGGRAFTAECEKRLREAGVRVITGNGVSGIKFSSSGRIDGVTLDDGAMFDADSVIYTGHPHYLPDLVPQGIFKRPYVRRLSSLENTASAYMLFGISDEPLPCLHGSNLFLCPDSDIDAFFEAGRDVDAGPFYVTMSPAGKSGKGCGITVMGPGDFAELTPWENTVSGKRGAAYETLKAEKLARLQKAVVAACPELAPVRFVEGASPLTLRDYAHSPGGSLYGCKHSLDQFNPQPVTRVPDLWLAGQSIIAPGILGAMISSFLICGFIVGPDTLREELLACS